MSNVFKYGSLNLLEHSEPVQAQTGIALPLELQHHSSCNVFRPIISVV